jgi:hypothetical protein
MMPIFNLHDINQDMVTEGRPVVIDNLIMVEEKWWPSDMNFFWL